MSAWENQGHQNNLEIWRQHNTTKTQQLRLNKHKMNHITILRSSDQRGRHAPSTSPPIGHAIGRVSEWTHSVWMSGLWSAEEPGSSPPIRGLWWGISPPPTPRGGGLGQESSCACRVCKRMDGRVVSACLCAWLEIAWLDENACREKIKR